MLSVMQILQVNLCRDKGASDLLEQAINERDIDIAVIAEPNVNYVKRRQWLVDDRTDVAIWLRSPRIRINSVSKGHGFVRIKVDDLQLYGCYFSPNRDMEEFDGFLNILRDETRRYYGHKIVMMGDFNAKSPAWGSPRICLRVEIFCRNKSAGA
ncbi:uncharacterized protein LOC108914942 [Anoplophora glabripennis]|uniref:uncharacterized protein LOC108914942 n=1 Tax=Anoplophora glabripennis TaxID=217634 RepID=UPI0008750344|nr:uncharacterized protein LOC108914942 [Anoplophora glabripennis]